MRQTAEVQIHLRDENLRLNGRDLDQELSRFESSQNLNLVDVGTFFFAGPLGWWSRNDKTLLIGFVGENEVLNFDRPASHAPNVANRDSFR